MGKPGPTSNRSASGAMINKIIRRVPKYSGNGDKNVAKRFAESFDTYTKMKLWINGVENDCKNPFTKKCVKAGKNSGCGC